MKKLINTENSSLECLQDGLFFGLEYLKEKQALPDFSSYCREEALVFKGQKILSIEENSQKENIAFLLSYLSGAYTLISCFTERNFAFNIGASATKHFLHKEGEEQAIQKAGAMLYKDLKKKSLNFSQLLTKLKKARPKENCLLNEEELSLQEIKEALETFPEQAFELKINSSPLELEQWRAFKNIKSVYPSCLQGNFPLLKMQWTK